MLLQPDPHVTVLHMKLTDSRFPGWTFELYRHRFVFFATATRGGVMQASRHGLALASDALEDVREKVRAFQTELLAGSVAS